MQTPHLRDIRGQAEKVRDRYWPERILPVDAEKITEQRLRLSIDPIHDLHRLTDMDAYLKKDLTGIVVDYDFYMEDRFANRMRFSFAHELGHYFLHDYIYSRIGFESAHEWKNFFQSVPDIEYRNFEFQANEFAGRLLVPLDELRAEIRQALSTLEQHHLLLDYLTEDPYRVLSYMSTTIARVFGVSSNVVEKRIERERLWPPDE